MGGEVDSPWVFVEELAGDEIWVVWSEVGKEDWDDASWIVEINDVVLLFCASPTKTTTNKQTQIDKPIFFNKPSFCTDYNNYCK